MKRNTMIFALFIFGLLVIVAGSMFLNDQVRGQSPINTDEVINVPIWNIGNKWFFSDENGNMDAYSVNQIIEENGSFLYVAEYTTENDILQSYYSTEDLSMVRQKPLGSDMSVMFSPGIRSMPFPFDLETEETVNITQTMRVGNVEKTNSFRITSKVLGMEQIIVPAGTFETYKIQQTMAYDSIGSAAIVTTLWYSPEVRYLVKIQTNDGTITELMSYNLVV